MKKTEILALILFLHGLILMMSGCSERDAQKWKDPALATDDDMQQLKKDVAEVNRKLDLLLNK